MLRDDLASRCRWLGSFYAPCSRSETRRGVTPAPRFPGVAGRNCSKLRGVWRFVRIWIGVYQAGMLSARWLLFPSRRK